MKKLTKNMNECRRKEEKPTAQSDKAEFCWTKPTEQKTPTNKKQREKEKYLLIQ